MPELPEVDLVARSLNGLVAGRTIVSAELRRQRLAPHVAAAEFSKKLTNTSILSVSRRGKHILFTLENDLTLVVHLRMSGRFSLLGNGDEERKFTHAIFDLDGGQRLAFDDQRHFGFMNILSTSDLNEAAEIKNLAPEPFSIEFSPRYLHEHLQRSNRSLKEFLLDQTKVTGLGNIYAAEAMFAAKIDPRLKANKVSKPRAAKLYEAILAVLSEQIELSKIGEIDPRNIDGRYFADDTERGWLVYDREGEPCVNCNSPILRLKQGGRSTYYCRTCQRR